MDDFYWREEVYENIVNLKLLTHASGLNLHWTHRKHDTVTDIQTDIRTFEECFAPVEGKKYLASLAIERKKIIVVKNVEALYESNPEITINIKATCIICLPIISFEGKVLLVLELYKSGEEPFSQQKALGYILEFAKWFSIWLSQRYLYNVEAGSANFQGKLQALLFEYVNGTASYENFLSRFMVHCMKHICADRCFFYDYNNHTDFCDLYEIVNEKLSKLGGRLKVFKPDSILSKIRMSENSMEVHITKDSKQLEKEMKQDPKNPIVYMFYYPVLFGSRFLGVLIFANTAKRDTIFTEEEKFHISRMSKPLADILTYRLIIQEQERQAAHQAILRETLINMLKARMRPQYPIVGSVMAPHRLHRLSLELHDLNDPNQMTYVCKMFQNIYHFDWDRLKDFLLCAQIAHNDYPFHNMKTTYHVCRTIYCIIEKLDAKVKPHEKAALMITAVCYYCGHNGLDNTMMLKSGHPLTKIYKTYLKENHRVWMMKLLLDQTKILANCKEGDLIVCTATNLLLKTRKYESKEFRQKMTNMLDANKFNMAKCTIRMYALMAILRIGIHGRHMQPFNLAKKLRDNYYEEILNLGDIEKEKGVLFMERKNRETRLSISHFEIIYIKNSVLPTLEILTRIFPETAQWMKIPRDVLKAHEILVGAGNKTLWDPEMCVDFQRSRLLRNK